MTRKEDMECKIHRMEDKMLREKNFYEQLAIREVLQKMRLEYSRLREA